MKQAWLKWSTKINALSLRERAIVFAAMAGGMVFMFFYGFLNPLYVKQKGILSQISQNQNQISGMEGEILQKIQAFGKDPDAADKLKLAQISQEMSRLTANLRAVQKGVVAPDKMAALLEQILKANGRLQLVALKTLPTTNLRDEVDRLDKGASKPAGTDGKAAKPAKADADESLLYRHGVELTVQGNYLDMIEYMKALESLPAQLFWGQAKLDVEEFPRTKLNLTVYTLSLDKNWMKL